jgi:peptidoglycan hydrolase CwlO-like protein
MAVWFFLVVSSFLFLYVITDDYNTLTEQAVMLIGIGSGTALGAAVIDVGKRNVLDRERESLAGLEGETQKLKDRIAENQKSTQDDPERNSQDQPTLNELTSKLAEMNVRRVEAETRVKHAGAVLIKDGSSNGFMDLLTDANGISFHRFQMVVWTVILIILFFDGVYRNLAMPEFNATLLALMGISSGTYLGFKIPELQSK